MATSFQVGRTYATRSIGDHDCVFSFTILARTAKTITTSVHGTEPRLEMLGFPAITLRQLVADGFAWSIPRTFANPAGLTVTHYHVSDAGKTALASRKGAP